MEKNREPNRIANLSQEELEKLENLEQRFGYTLVAYENEQVSSRQDEDTSFK